LAGAAPDYAALEAAASENAAFAVYMGLVENCVVSFGELEFAEFEWAGWSEHTDAAEFSTAVGLIEFDLPVLLAPNQRESRLQLEPAHLPPPILMWRQHKPRIQENAVS
jgi:hypothetical protein